MQQAVVSRICEQCGASFQVERWRAARGLGRFCSQQCSSRWVGHYHAGARSSLWNGGPVDRVCAHCGATFQAKPSHVARGRAMFCSPQCRTDARRTLADRPCEQCRMIFHPYNRAQRFCSLQCRSQRLQGPLSSRWRGGKSFEPYPPTFNEAFKRRIRERDSYTCALCGALNSRDVHHINYVKDDTAPENCITLCTSCHSKTNSNRDYWQALCTGIMALRAWLNKAEVDTRPA